MLRRHVTRLEVAAVEERTFNRGRRSSLPTAAKYVCTTLLFVVVRGVLPLAQTTGRLGHSARDTRSSNRKEEENSCPLRGADSQFTQPEAAEEVTGRLCATGGSILLVVRVIYRRVSRDPQRLIRNPAANDTGTSSRTH